jgi:hypothetical protein
VGVGVIVALWPHIVKQKMGEEVKDKEPLRSSDKSSD